METEAMNVVTNLVTKTEPIDEEDEINTRQNQSELVGNLGTETEIKTEPTDKEDESRTYQTDILQSQWENRLIKPEPMSNEEDRRRQPELAQQQRGEIAVKLEPVKNDKNIRVKGECDCQTDRRTQWAHNRFKQRQSGEIVIKPEPMKNDSNIRVRGECNCHTGIRPQQARNMFNAVVRKERLSESIVSNLLSGRQPVSPVSLLNSSAVTVKSEPVSGAVDVNSEPVSGAVGVNSEPVSDAVDVNFYSEPVSGAVDIKLKPVFDVVVRLERLDDAIVSALMPGRQTESASSPPDTSDSSYVDIKSEPVYFEETFYRSPAIHTKNTTCSVNRKQLEGNADSAKRKKRKEVELVRTDGDEEANHAVRVRTSQGELIRCFPLPISTNKQSTKLASRDYDNSTRDSLLKENVDRLCGRSFPTFSGYVPSGRKPEHTKKPEQSKRHFLLGQLVSKRVKVSVHPEKKRQKTKDVDSVGSSSSDQMNFSVVSGGEMCVRPDASGPPDNSFFCGYDVSDATVQKSFSLNCQKHVKGSDEKNLKVTDPSSEESPGSFMSQATSCVDDVTNDRSTRNDSTTTSVKTMNMNIMEVICGENCVGFSDEGNDKGNQVQQSCSKNVVYPPCECVAPSWFESMEANLWRSVVLTSCSCMNLGLLRFMDKNLFTFSKNDQPYVFLPELEFRGLLRFGGDECSWVQDLLSTPLISCELRPLETAEMHYIEQYLWVQRTVERGLWFCQMITPCGLHLLFQGLHQCQGSPHWFVPAHSLFYQMRLAHHCRWTLQVTPPIMKGVVSGQQKAVVDRTLSFAFNDYKQYQKVVIVPVQDGGAGTSIDHHNLSPSLKKALKYCLELFRLDKIAEPFCDCELDVRDVLTFRPLNIKNVTFPHMTHVHFMGSMEPLYCWKRPDSFYISLAELIEKSHLPPRDHKTLQALLAAATMGSDVCIMLEPEKMFLGQLKMEETLRNIPCREERSEASKEERQAAIASFLEAQERLEEECEASSKKSQEQREDLLINLIYLRKMYQELAKTEAVFQAHSQAKFYIKHWPHICALEDNSLCLHDDIRESSEQSPEYMIAEEGEPITDTSEQQEELSSHKGDEITEREEGEKTEPETGWFDVEDMIDVQECPPVVFLMDQKGLRDASSWKEAKGVRVDNGCYSRQECDHETWDALEEEENMKGQKEQIINQADSTSSDESECDEHQHEIHFHPGESEGHGTEGSGQSVPKSSGQSASSVGDRGRGQDLLSPVRPGVEATRLGYTSHVTRRGQVVKGQSHFHEFQHTRSQKDTGGSWLFREPEDMNMCPIKQKQVDTHLSWSDSQQLSLEGVGSQEGDQALNLQSYTQKKQCLVSSHRSEDSYVADSEIQSLPVPHPSPSCTHTLSVTHSSTKKQCAGHKAIQTQLNGDDGDQIQSAFPSGGDTQLDNPCGMERKEREQMSASSPSKLSETSSFKMKDYPQSCSCPDEVNDGILKPISLVQCFFSSRARKYRIHSLHHVGQAIISGHVLFTFTYKDKLYLSLAQLQAVGLVICHDDLHAYLQYMPIHWVRRVYDEEAAFLIYNGIHVSSQDFSLGIAHSCLVSAELLCSLSDDNIVVKKQLRQRDIYIHRVGHICADSATQAGRTVDFENKKYLELVLEAWSRCASLQEELKDMEQRRMAEKCSTGHAQIFPKECPDQVTSPTATLLQDDGQGQAQSTGTSDLSVQKNQPASQCCAVYMRNIKSKELEMKPPQQGRTFYVCSPNSHGVSFVVKRKTRTSVKKNKLLKENKWTDVFEGAMLPKLLREKNLCLKTGIGFCELDTDIIQQWIGDKFSTHDIVLTGTLSIGPYLSEYRVPTTFCCFKIKDKLYVNWGEISARMVGSETIFSLAHRLHVFMYDLPKVLSLHLCRHFEGNKHISMNPWLCVNSLNAIGWLGLIDDNFRSVFPKTLNLLALFFHSTNDWSIQLRNFVLLPKAQHSPSSHAEK